jgi:hypothetical protein
MTQMTQNLKIPSICAAARLGHASAEPSPNRDPKDPIMQNAHNVKIVVDSVKQSLTIATLGQQNPVNNQLI